LRSKTDQLQAALEKSRSDLETVQKEKAAVNTHLEETSSKLQDAQKEIETLKEAQTADLKNAIAAAEEARATAEKQRDETNAKLAEATRQITAVEQQRDEALAQLKAGSETEQDPQALLAENGDLKLKLANLEKNVPANANSTNVEELVEVKQEVTQLQQQLAETQRQNQYFVARIAELWVQLDDAGAELQSAKPVVSVSEQNRGALTASFIFAKKSAGDSVEGEVITNNSGGLKEQARDGAHSVVHPARESFSGASTEPQKPMSGSPDQGSE
jgi:chromosome segregation ATPase